VLEYLWKFPDEYFPKIRAKHLDKQWNNKICDYGTVNMMSISGVLFLGF
jgi:hypothetical protein